MLFELFELVVDGIDAGGYAFFECVGDLGGHLFAIVGHDNLDAGLLVLGGFGFYHGEDSFEIGHRGVVALQFLSHFVDVVGEFLRHIEVNALDSDFHDKFVLS